MTKKTFRKSCRCKSDSHLTYWNDGIVSAEVFCWRHERASVSQRWEHNNTLSDLGFRALNKQSKGDLILQEQPQSCITLFDFLLLHKKALLGCCKDQHICHPGLLEGLGTHIELCKSQVLLRMVQFHKELVMQVQNQSWCCYPTVTYSIAFLCILKKLCWCC